MSTQSDLQELNRRAEQAQNVRAFVRAQFDCYLDREIGSSDMIDNIAGAIEAEKDLVNYQAKWLRAIEASGVNIQAMKP